MKRVIWILVIGACSADSSPYVTGFAPPPPASNHERMIAPPILDVPPGSDVTYCQWLANPSDTDRQIADVSGYQSRGGHHLVLYATTVHEAVGTSRMCTQEDMLSITFVGAVGGEGTSGPGAKLPEGLAFQVPAGMSLMANTHYLNATDDAFDAQSVVDVQFGDPKHPLPSVGFLAVNWAGFMIPHGSQAYTSDGWCTATRKLSFIMWTNHMHEYGTSVFSEVVRQDTTVVPVSMDAAWRPEQAFNAPWVRWDPTSPMVVNPGDQFHVSCTWHNMTSADIGPPREMCIASGFTLEAMPQTICQAK
jgi:hypothetical protein